MNSVPWLILVHRNGGRMASSPLTPELRAAVRAKWGRLIYLEHTNADGTEYWRLW